MELVLGIIGMVLLVSTGLVAGMCLACRDISKMLDKEIVAVRAEDDLLYKFARSLDGIELTKKQARDIKDIVDIRTCNKN